MRLLLVDQDRRSAALRQASLENLGFVVKSANLAGQANLAAELSGCDALVLSLNGFTPAEAELVRSCRDAAPRLPLLALLSQDSKVQERVDCLDAGADGYVLHSGDSSELAARLRALGRRREPGEPVVYIHDLEINSETRQVRRGGELIPLTPREFSLLQLLARRQGRVVSRSMIHEHLYKDGHQGNSNIIDVYIGYLRQKIDKGHPTRLILTVRGQGYQLRGNAN